MTFETHFNASKSTLRTSLKAAMPISIAATNKRKKWINKTTGHQKADETLHGKEENENEAHW